MFGDKVMQISAEEAFDKLQKNDDITVIDVRTEDEAKRGKIINSINIPLDKLDVSYHLLPNKDKVIFVYCLSGSRSALAVKLLERNGYKNVFNITSGLLAWRAKGYQLV